MSGVTLAVAQPSDSSEPLKTDQTTRPQSPMRSLRVIELQLIAFIMVFSISGLVPLLDLIVPLFITIYLLLLARFAFPSNCVSSSPEIYQTTALFRAYVIVGTTLGLFLPLAYVLGGFARSDDRAVRSVTPHLFLLSCQILTENVISGLTLFSPPLRAFVPLLYTIRRLFVIIDWMNEVWVLKTLPENALFQEILWHWFGKVLSVANVVYYSLNLFGFLIPGFLPKAFERYFKEDGKIAAAQSEDKSFDKKGD